MKKVVLVFAVLLSACSGEPVPVSVSPEPVPVVSDGPEVHPQDMEVLPYRAPARVEALMGLAPNAVIKKMGAPSLVRRDNLAQVMLFEHEACVFDIVFYAESVGSPFRVSYISARNRQGLKSDTQQCLTIVKPDGFNSGEE